MIIKDFAARHTLRTKRDEVGEEIVIAKHGQIYEHGSGQFGVMFLMDSIGKWNNRRKDCERAGMTVIQDGDTEGTLLFDPDNKAQVRTAIRLVGARQKRALSPEARKQAVENLARFRNAAPAPHSEGQKRP